jgi:glycosyltransferase involved in cell wall biosynthesis
MVSERWFPSVGGGEYHILHLVRGLTRQGVEIDLVSRDLEGTVRPEGWDGLRGFRVVRLPPRSPFEHPLGRALYPPLLVRAVRRLDPHDLIHVHCPLGSFPSAYLRQRLRLPLVRTLHGVYAGKWSAMFGRTPTALVFSALEALSLSLHYDAMITVDRQAMRLLPGGKGRIHWIPNGVNLEAFDRARPSRAERFTFLFVGRLVPQKGVEHLLKACRMLEQRGHEFRVMVVGRGPELSRLERRATVDGLQNVRFLGVLDEEQLVGLYLSAHAFVLPSLWEGLPLTLLEAWAARLPVVASHVGGIPEVAVDGENALLVPPGDPSSLAERMEAIIEDHELRRRLGESGRRLVEERFTWERVARETLRVYEECVSGKGRPRGSGSWKRAA